VETVVARIAHADALDRLRRNFGVSANKDNNSRNAKPQTT